VKQGASDVEDTHADDTPGAGEATTARQVMAVYYLLLAAGAGRDLTKEELGRFMEFLTGKKASTTKRYWLNPTGKPDKQGNTTKTTRENKAFVLEFFKAFGAERAVGLQELLKLAAQPDKEAGAYACVRMSSVKAEKVEWLWKPYLPLGKITLLDGWPGIGKSWLTCKLAAIVTRGGFPNGVAFEPGNVLMFSAEDGLADTLRPRLDACGADVERIIALNFLEKDGLAVFDEKGLMRFEATIIEHQPLLVIVNPLFAFTGGAIDINRANECREVSRVLAAIAARQRCNMLGVRHLGKSGGNGSPMKAGIGSIDWLAAARVGLLAGCDPDDESKCALTCYKNNLAPKGASLGYRITFDPDTDIGSFEWIGESDLTAERILAPAHHEDSEEAGQRADAEDFLRPLLNAGPAEAKDVETARRAAGVSDYSLR
jgi:hypothetical protein